MTIEIPTVAIVVASILTGLVLYIFIGGVVAQRHRGMTPTPFHVFGNCGCAKCRVSDAPIYGCIWPIYLLCISVAGIGRTIFRFFILPIWNGGETVGGRRNHAGEKENCRTCALCEGRKALDADKGEA